MVSTRFNRRSLQVVESIDAQMRGSTCLGHRGSSGVNSAESGICRGQVVESSRFDHLQRICGAHLSFRQITGGDGHTKWPKINEKCHTAGPADRGYKSDYKRASAAPTSFAAAPFILLALITLVESTTTLHPMQVTDRVQESTGDTRPNLEFNGRCMLLQNGRASRMS